VGLAVCPPPLEFGHFSGRLASKPIPHANGVQRTSPGQRPGYALLRRQFDTPSIAQHHALPAKKAHLCQS